MTDHKRLAQLNYRNAATARHLRTTVNGVNMSEAYTNLARWHEKQAEQKATEKAEHPLMRVIK